MEAKAPQTLTTPDGPPLLSESIRVPPEPTRPLIQFESSSRLASVANRFKKSSLVTVQKRIGSTPKSSRFCVLSQLSFEKTFSENRLEGSANRFKRSPLRSVHKRIGSPQIRVDSKRLANPSFSQIFIRVDSNPRRIDLKLKPWILSRNELNRLSGDEFRRF
ncbi:hypothetical protein PIB30_043434 [Stylosanthes scabra]|uniref:Uncharacterized protein n=1 Tax=Stylosanthes scabra TaxID=79078 RepID=A0ABU6UFC9_9FABA|nr:hypothetical protein [Stylosanthes scabra]